MQLKDPSLLFLHPPSLPLSLTQAAKSDILVVGTVVLANVTMVTVLYEELLPSTDDVVQPDVSRARTIVTGMETPAYSMRSINEISRNVWSLNKKFTGCT